MKASLVGSVIGNILLVLGAAMLVGGLAAREADLQPTAANAQAGDAAARRSPR